MKEDSLRAKIEVKSIVSYSEYTAYHGILLIQQSQALCVHTDGEVHSGFI